MAITTTKSYYWRGFRDGSPFIVMAVPFGMLFGLLATESGLNVVQTMSFSATVFAGAAQFTALHLLRDDAPTIVAILSALAVNLRVAMYSASLTPYLGAAPLWQRAFAAYFTIDQSYACSMMQFEKEPKMRVPERIRYFFGVVTPLTPAWLVATYLGAVVGTRIPESWGLDFALPITFLAMVGPMLRTFSHVVAALVAIIVALLTTTVPYNLGLLIAGCAGMMAGARSELVLERRRAAA
ncbi:AzlC family ABC transporter permease [Ruegeria hyattellae]|jgi:4-azaleucine resistance transporter AzlC|uniref:AzlC family ABC transporter permease n=1 Tax=Ruegeria hyattellae TaxID=3233337 RepID=UPI00355C7F3E